MRLPGNDQQSDAKPVLGLPAAGTGASRWPPAIGGLLAAAVVVGAFLLPLPKMLRGSAASQEEGSVLEYGVLTLHGKVPIRDFQTLYGPASDWAPALALKIAGTSVAVERFLGLGYRALLLAALYSLGRRWGRVAGVTAALLCWAILLPFGPLAWAWIGGLAFASAGLACLVGGTRSGAVSRSWAATGGVLSGIALLFRPDLALAVGLSAAVLFTGALRPRRKVWLAGLGVGVAAYLWLFITAGPVSVFRGLVLDPVFRMRSGRTLPVPPSTSHVAEYFTRVFSTLPAGHRWPGLGLPAQLAGYFYVLLAAILVITMAAIRVRRRNRGGALMAVAAFALGLAPQLLQRPEVNHMRIVGCVWIALLPIALLELSGWVPTPPRGWAYAVTGALVALVLVATSTFFVGQLAVDALPGIEDNVNSSPSTVTFSARKLPVGSSGLAHQINDVVAVVNRMAHPGQRLFVGPADLRFTNYNETYLYYLLPHLVPATYFLEMNPGLANRPGSGLARDVASADWVILTSRFINWSEPNTSTRPGSDVPNQVIAHDFCPVARTFPYEVLEHKRRAMPTAGCPQSSS